MAFYEIEIRDEITIARKARIVVEAEDLGAADEIAQRMTGELVYPEGVVSGQKAGDYVDLQETEIDNTPWEWDVTERPDYPASAARRATGNI